MLMPFLLLALGGAICVGILSAMPSAMLELAKIFPSIEAPEPQWRDDLIYLLIVFVPVALVGLGGARWFGNGLIPAGANAARDLPLGLLIGIGATSAAFAILAALGHTMPGDQSHRATALGFMAGTFAILVQTSAEEIFFRGWLQQATARYWDQWPAVIATSLLFAAVHYNVIYTWQALANVFLAGVFFGTLFRVSGGIALPIAAHFGWNWTEFLLLDLLPKGENPFGSIFDYDLRQGAAMFGGSADGMNASIAVSAVLLALIALLFVVNRRRSSARAKPPVVPQPVTAKQVAPKVPDAVAPAKAAATMFEPAADIATPANSFATPPSPPPSLLPVGSGNLRVQDDAITHVGRVREINEDRLFADARMGVWAVADGMGGHEFGERASSAIVESLQSAGSSDDFEGKIESVRAAILAANASIYSEAQSRGQRMGSTVVALVIVERQYAILWAGDSRAYLLRDGQLKRISRDHTQVQALIDRGMLAPEDAEGHPMSHVLARAIGVMPQVDVDIVRDTVQPNDIFLLCSDGLYGLVSDAEIAEMLSPSKLGDAADALIAMSLERGAPDNVTAVAVSASEVTLISFGKDRTDSK